MEWWTRRNVYVSIILFVVHLSIATKKAQCNGWTLTAPDEGDFTCSPLGVTISMSGTRCTLKCNMGYQAVQDVVVCSESGGWVPTNSPQCAADSTMTLTIVLSIMGSISLLVCLGIQYGRRRCQGKRRKLEEEDAEIGARKEVTDTSTYYGRVQRLRRKRRMQAEKQKFKAAMSAVGQAQKPVTKQPNQNKREAKLKRGKKSIRTISRGIKSRAENVGNKKASSKQNRRPRLIPGKKAKNQQEPKRTFYDLMRCAFCIICDSFSKRKEKNGKRDPMSSSKRNGANQIKIFSISEDPAPKKRKISTDTSESSMSSSSSSSSSESSSDDDKEEKTPPSTDDTKTPSSRPPKAPPKPPPPKPKQNPNQPPPRPPAPMKIPERLRKKPSPISSEGEESNSPTHTESFITLHGQQDIRIAVSSGYSSDTDRHRRHREPHDGQKSAVQHKNSSASRSEKPIARSTTKRMEMLSPGDLQPEEVTGNPYENYPAALSYRQYQDFENDYRRTTGEYRPQYTNLKVIPIQTRKKEKTKESEKIRDEEEEKEKNRPRTKTPVGGVKYIGIIERGSGTGSDSDNENDYYKRSSRKHHQRYEDPADRDRRRHIPDDDRRRRPPRHHKNPKDESSRKERRAKRDRKREIEDEKIIDDGKRSKVKKETEKLSNKPHEPSKKRSESGREEKGKIKQEQRTKNDYYKRGGK